MVNRPVRIHLFNENELIGRTAVHAVPRAGDEVRLGGPGHEKYFKVKRVVWCLDEQSVLGDMDRANVELEPAP